MYLEKNLSKIRQIAAEREYENVRFRTFLKGKNGRNVDSIVHRLHREITPHIDCSTCGNCCYCLSAEISAEDIKTLARLENISPEEYRTRYCGEEFKSTYLKDIPCRYVKVFMRIGLNSAGNHKIRPF